MNRQEYLLTLLMEECAEVSQRASKCLRFGMKDTQPGHELNNTSRLLHEVIDVLTVLEMLTEEGLLPDPENVDVKGLFAEKRERLAKYMKLSQDLGCLDVQTAKGEVPTCEHVWTNPKNEPAYCQKCGVYFSEGKCDHKPQLVVNMETGAQRWRCIKCRKPMTQVVVEESNKVIAAYESSVMVPIERADSDAQTAKQEGPYCRNCGSVLVAVKVNNASGYFMCEVCRDIR